LLNRPQWVRKRRPPIPDCEALNRSDNRSNRWCRTRTEPPQELLSELDHEEALPNPFENWTSAARHLAKGLQNQVRKEAAQVFNSMETETRTLLFQQIRMLNQAFNLEAQANRQLQALLKQVAMVGPTWGGPALLYNILLESLPALPLFPPQAIQWFVSPVQEEDPAQGKGAGESLVVLVETATLGRFHISLQMPAPNRLVIDVTHGPQAEAILETLSAQFTSHLREHSAIRTTFNYHPQPEAPPHTTQHAQADRSEAETAQEGFGASPKRFALVLAAQQLVQILLVLDQRSARSQEPHTG
jgi:hypothetical protein